MQKNKYTRLIKDILIFIVGNVLTKVVQFLLMPLYTTYMTTEAYGVAELTNNISLLLYPIVTLCIYEAAFRYVVGSKYTSEEIITASIKVVFLSALVGAGVLVLSNTFIHYKYANSLYFILYAFSFRTLMAYYVRGKGHTKVFAASGIINAIFLALFSYLFLVVLKLDVWGYLMGIGISYICSALFLFIGGGLYKELKFSIHTKDITKDLLYYSMPLVIYNIGYWLTTMSGRYILLWFADVSTAGIYAAVIKIAAIISMLEQAFYAAFQLNASREYESKDKEAYYSSIFRLYAVGIIILGSVILCMSPLLAKFTLRNEFYAARIYLPLVLFIAIIDCLFCFYKTMYTAYKLTSRTVPSMFIGSVINIVVGVLTVRQFGIWGICFASFLCYSSQALYRIIDVRKFVNLKVEWKVIIPYLLLLGVQVLLLSTYELVNILIAIALAIFIFASLSGPAVKKIFNSQKDFFEQSP